jgi:hypothetical protein
MSSEISSAADAVNPPNQSKQRERRLEWWSRIDDPDLHWALAARGRYVALRDSASGRWSVTFRKGRKEEILGVAASLSEAKTLAESRFRANEH